MAKSKLNMAVTAASIQAQIRERIDRRFDALLADADNEITLLRREVRERGKLLVSALERGDAPRAWAADTQKALNRSRRFSVCEVTPPQDADWADDLGPSTP